MTEENELNSIKFETDSQVCFCVLLEFISINKFKFQTNSDIKSEENVEKNIGKM
jgi:hypothetical protein